LSGANDVVASGFPADPPLGNVLLASVPTEPSAPDWTAATVMAAALKNGSDLIWILQEVFPHSFGLHFFSILHDSVALLILFTECLQIRFAVPIEEILASLFPLGFALGCRGIPVAAPLFS
jgi:hypothetical protein